MGTAWRASRGTWQLPGTSVISPPGRRGRVPSRDAASPPEREIVLLWIGSRDRHLRECAREFVDRLGSWLCSAGCAHHCFRSSIALVAPARSWPRARARRGPGPEGHCVRRLPRPCTTVRRTSPRPGRSAAAIGRALHRGSTSRRDAPAGRSHSPQPTNVRPPSLSMLRAQYGHSRVRHARGRGAVLPQRRHICPAANRRAARARTSTLLQTTSGRGSA